MRIKLFLAVLFCVGLAAITVQAADVVVPGKDTSDVYISSGQTHEDLYAAGANVTLSGEVKGDLAAVGASVTVNGSVEQDAMLGGGTIYLNGSVGDDARLGGGNVTVNAPISGDLVLAAGMVNITDRSSVRGDLMAGAGNLTLNAPVSGTVRIAGGNITINSRVDGELNIRANQLVFGPNAEVTGKIVYRGPQEAVVQSGARVGNIEYIPYQKEGRKAAALFTVAFFVKLLAWILTALVLSWIFRGFPLLVAGETFRAPWKNLGIGFLGLIAVPIATILLLLTFVGYYLALLLILGYILLIAVALVLSAVALGYLVLRYLVKPTEIIYWQAIIIGVVLWYLLRLVPVIGWVVMLVVFLMTFGALIRMGTLGFTRKKE